VLDTAKLFGTALGLQEPWYVRDVEFDAAAKKLTLKVDFREGTHFPHPAAEGLHQVYDTEKKILRHLNFFQHECYLEVRIPRVQLPDGNPRLAEPDWVGKLDGFTLLFEAFVLVFCRAMTFSAAARIFGISEHRAKAICHKYVNQAVEQADYSKVNAVAIDETSRARGHNYVTLVADSERRAVIFVTEGKDAETVQAFASDLSAHKGNPETIESISMDMSPAFIKGVNERLPNARITFDKFHVIKHASEAVDEMRRIEQKTAPDLKGMRWKLLKNYDTLSRNDRAEVDVLISRLEVKRTARAWVYREQLREILDRKQINVVSTMLWQWCTNVMRSKVEPMKDVARMIRSHFDGIVAWAQTRQTNGFMEALNGLFQSAKRSARGYASFATIRTVIFLRIGKLDFSQLNPHVPYVCKPT
jgi:transposase